jgi:hypothetical protein
MRITSMFLALAFAGAGLASGTAPAQTQAARAAQPEDRRPYTALQQAAHFVVADGRGSVWVVDAAAPAVDGIVPEGPKLVSAASSP